MGEKLIFINNFVCAFFAPFVCVVEPMWGGRKTMEREAIAREKRNWKWQFDYLPLGRREDKMPRKLEEIVECTMQFFMWDNFLACFSWKSNESLWSRASCTRNEKTVSCDFHMRRSAVVWLASGPRFPLITEFKKRLKVNLSRQPMMVSCWTAKVEESPRASAICFFALASAKTRQIAANWIIDGEVKFMEAEWGEREKNPLSHDGWIRGLGCSAQFGIPPPSIAAVLHVTTLSRTEKGIGNSASSLRKFWLNSALMKYSSSSCESDLVASWHFA